VQVSKFAFQRRLLEFARSKELDFSYLERAVANTILVQIITNSSGFQATDFYFKGGSSLIFRSGMIDSRTTKDLDMAVAAEKSSLRTLVEQLVGETWHVFTVHGIKEQPVGAPVGVPEDEIILRYRVQLLIGESEWRSVILEVA